MIIEDTAGNVYIKPGNCDCGLTGGCKKCKGIFIPKNLGYYPPNEGYYQDRFTYMFPEIRCPNCGKILKKHVCGEED